MIDTLRLNLVDCDIKRSCPLSIQGGVLDYSTGLLHNENDLFIDNTGKIIRGSKAYLNDEKFNLTINPSTTTEMTEYGKSKLKVKRFKRISETIQPDLYDYNETDFDETNGIFLQTSLPRLLNDNNLKTLSLSDQQTALKFLESKLRTYGIRTNILNANLSRVDTFTNISTDFNFYSYSNLFSLMECSRMKAVGYGNESFLWKNGNQELMIYDKVREMMEKSTKWFLNERKNVMRFENRLLKKRKILSTIKFKTVDELYKNYDELKNFHKREITKKIFKYTFDEVEKLTSNKIENQFLYCKRNFGDKWLDYFFKMEGMKSIIKVMDKDFLLSSIEKLDAGKKDVALRVKKSRVRKLYNEMILHIGIFESTNKDGLLKSNVELYNELKTKFYKEVA